MKKFLCLISAVMLHLAVGSVYAWSVLINPIMEFTGWSRISLTLVFGVTIACLGFSTLMLGRRVKNTHPANACSVALFCYVLGMGLTTAAIHYHTFVLLLIGYGFILGFGTGVAYLTPIPILMTWFKRWRGIATGLVVTGFGFSSLIAAYGYHYCIVNVGLEMAPAVVGTAMSLLMIPSIFFLRPAPKPKAKEETVENYKGETQLLKNKQFRLLWTLFFINISIGIAIISVLSPMTQKLFNVTTYEAALLVGTVGVVNGAARLCWSTVSDFIGRPITVTILIVFELTAVVSLIYFQTYEIFRACIFVIIACYGGLFALMPSYIADLFGIDKVNETFGHVLTAWGVAGIISPLALAWFVNETGNYHHFFYGALLLCMINTAVALTLSERNVTRV